MKPSLFQTFLAIFAFAALSPVASAQDAREIQERALEAFRDGEYVAAEEALREQIELTPGDFVPHYNLACALSRQGRVDEAAEALTNAVSKGFSDLVQLKRDPYLAGLREHERVRTLIENWDRVQGLRANAEEKHLREKFGERYVYARDDVQRLIFACAFGETTLAQAQDELDLVVRFADSITEELAEAREHDAWVSVILPDREDFMGWAVREFGAAAVSGSMGIGGQYSHDRKQLVCQDLGATLRHEFFHALHWRHATRLGQRHPAWIQEGLASLVEDLDGRGEPVASWRTNMTKRLAKSGRITPIEDMADLPRSVYFKGRPLARYAEARGVFLYLHDRGQLREFYTRYCENYEEDPKGVETLKSMLGEDWRAINREYRLWLRELEEAPEEIKRGMASIGIAIEPGTGEGPVVAELVRSGSGMGLKLGDIITAIDGRTTRDMGELVRVLSGYEPGQTVEISYRRRDTHGTTSVTLVEKK